MRERLGLTPADVVHRENKWRLLRYRPAAGEPGPRHDTPVLLVPSLINRHYVLDLMPGKSFVEHLVADGHEVYCIDWGTPQAEDRLLGLDTVVDTYLGRAIRKAGAGGGGGGSRPVHLMGYCLGGTLAAIHAAMNPVRVASLMAVAAPIGFEDQGLLSAWSRTGGLDAASIVDGLGNLPWPVMQGAFQMLRPTLGLAKAVRWLDKWRDVRFRESFLALETWGADNVDFPGRAFADYIERLYRDDGLVRGTLTVSGRPVRLADVRCPVLAVTFEHDNIVPPDSAAALLDHVGSVDAERIHLPGGHVGAMTSRAAKAKLWPRLSAWWADRPAGVRKPGAVRTISV